MMNYVCGFFMSWDMQEFILIRKTHPDWQKGKWNGVGGKIESYIYDTRTGVRLTGSPGELVKIQSEAKIGDLFAVLETPHAAMEREFLEETGIRVKKERWQCFHIARWKGISPDGKEDSKVYFFAAFGDEIKKFESPEDVINREQTFNDEIRNELVAKHTLVDMYFDGTEKYIYNIPYLIQMIIKEMRQGFFMKLNPEGVNTDAR